MCLKSIVWNIIYSKKDIILNDFAVLKLKEKCNLSIVEKQHFKGILM